MVDKDVPRIKNNTPAAAPVLPLIKETMTSKEEKQNNNNSAPETPDDMTLI